jgi:hypothetical protein
LQNLDDQSLIFEPALGHAFLADDDGEVGTGDVHAGPEAAIPQLLDLEVGQL